MLKHHLNGGVRKGALTQEEADKKFAAWLEEKEAKIQARKDGLSKEQAEAKAKRLAAEKAASEKRLADAAAVEADAEEAVSYTHLRAHETKANLVCRLLLEKKKKNKKHTHSKPHKTHSELIKINTNRKQHQQTHIQTLRH